MVVAGVVAITSLVTAGTAGAATDVASRAYVGCGNSYGHCVEVRRAYVRQGQRIGPLHFGQPGCTAPGCSNENWFYVYS
ncbi:hypothetical protein GCM10023320_49560 [Pseudonocardia adelaidensis]|uniref:Secreted protein n=2 Tax=Pseudonocardia adelaidensis TaxID=648754 RepID=A0ABP9NNY9_9PSEU